jgi:hypothetical protein
VKSAGIVDRTSVPAIALLTVSIVTAKPQCSQKHHLRDRDHITSTGDLVSLMSEPLTGAETTRHLAHQSKGLKHSRRNYKP